MADAKIVLGKDEIIDLLGGLAKQMAIFAPVSNGKKLDYQRVSAPGDIVFSDELPYKSPKELFFPRSEKIIAFKDGEAVALHTSERFVLFAARPCDLEALAIIRKILTEGKFRDSFVEERFDNSLIIGLGCEGKKPGCFCDERETDLNYSDKCDLFFGVGEGGAGGQREYEVMYVSEKGREAFGGYIKSLIGFENITHEFAPKKTLSLDVTEKELFDIPDWKKLTNICQGCGMCTFICPTCHCFSFKDVDEGGAAYRYRNWDSCMFPKFTLHASGHNPRAERHERYRQRVAHKYLYVKENIGAVACTGCGRCVRGCPAGMSIKTIVESIAGGNCMDAAETGKITKMEGE